MEWFFLIFSTLCWGVAEIFYKLGNLEKEKYAHLKTAIFVGFFMGIYSVVILFTQGVEIAYLPENFLRYLPVAACYIVSMACSYFGVRFIEESISDPIENTGGTTIVPILCAFFLHQWIDNPWVIVCICVVAVGLLLLGLFDKKGKKERHEKLSKKLAIAAIAMPFTYMLLDAVGTFLDIFYTDDWESTFLVHVTEDNLEHTANCCYEFTFLLVAIGLYIFIRLKGEKLFSLGAAEEVKLDENGNAVVNEKKWYQKVLGQKWKILAAIFETGGQATYLFALGEGGIAAVILGAGTVICSVILSAVWLKERLSWIQYVFIGIILVGIIALSLLGL